jgi:hypothetical protein
MFICSASNNIQHTCFTVEAARQHAAQCMLIAKKYLASCIIETAVVYLLLNYFSHDSIVISSIQDVSRLLLTIITNPNKTNKQIAPYIVTGILLSKYISKSANADIIQLKQLVVEQLQQHKIECFRHYILHNDAKANLYNIRQQFLAYQTSYMPFVGAIFETGSLGLKMFVFMLICLYSGKTQICGIVVIGMVLVFTPLIVACMLPSRTIYPSNVNIFKGSRFNRVPDHIHDETVTSTITSARFQQISSTILICTYFCFIMQLHSALIISVFSILIFPNISNVITTTFSVWMLRNADIGIYNRIQHAIKFNVAAIIESNVDITLDELIKISNGKPVSSAAFQSKMVSNLMYAAKPLVTIYPVEFTTWINHRQMSTDQKIYLCQTALDCAL